MNAEPLYELLDEWMDSRISDEHTDKLNALLGDSENRRIAVRYIDQHFALREMLGAAVAKPASNNASTSNNVAPIPSQKSYGFHWKLGAAALLLAAVTLFAIQFTRSNNAQIVNREPKIKETETDVAVVEPVACIVAGKDAVWSPEQKSVPKQNEFISSGRYRLQSGFLTLAMVGGVDLFVEGPIDFEIQSAARVFCHAGKLRAHVQPGAEGFQVLGPGIRVVDLGTEFGINVNPSGSSAVMVFEGKVDVSAMNPNGKTLRTERVVKDAAVEIDTKAGKIQAASADAAKFVKRMPGIVPPLPVGPEYAAAVRKSNPWSYWRFEHIQSGKCANDVVQQPAFNVVGGVELSTTLEGNRSLIFTDAVDPQYLLMDDAWQLHGDYAIEFWMASESVRKAAVISVSKAGSSKGQYILLETNALSADKKNSPAAFRYLHRPVQGAAGGNNIYSRSIVPFRWHHIVAQKRGSKMELYLDGVLSASESLDTEIFTGSGRLVIGRLWNSLVDDNKVLRPFIGRVDELAVYNRPLEGAEITEHARSVRWPVQ